MDGKKIKNKCTGAIVNLELIVIAWYLIETIARYKYHFTEPPRELGRQATNEHGLASKFSFSVQEQ